MTPYSVKRDFLDIREGTIGRPASRRSNKDLGVEMVVQETKVSEIKVQSVIVVNSLAISQNIVH